MKKIFKKNGINTEKSTFYPRVDFPTMDYPSKENPPYNNTNISKTNNKYHGMVKEKKENFSEEKVFENIKPNQTMVKDSFNDNLEVRDGK